MPSTKDIIERELKLIATNIRTNFVKKNRNATGVTSSEIVTDVITINKDKVEGTITAPSHVYELEFGRKPTEGEPTGNSTWINDLDPWLQARNIPMDAKYPIFKKIHEEGYKGTPGLVSDPVEDGIDRLVERVADAEFENLFKKVGK